MLLSTLLAESSFEVISGDVENREITGISIDSRHTGKGELFVCLRGARTDGHFFADKAYEKGCRVFLTERMLPELPDDALQIKVKDTRRELAVISAVYRGHPSRSLHIIGITGTKGKTTTALLIHSILNASGIKCAYVGSNGVIINGETVETPNTTPESCELQKYFRLMIDSGITHVALEVSSQALDHCRVYGVDFDVAVYTNLYRDHIGPGEHASFEEYKSAKAKLFRDYRSRLVVYNKDDGYAGEIVGDRQDKDSVSFSEKDGKADYCASSVSPFRDSTALGISFICSHSGKAVGFKLKTPGDFSVYNALAAIAVADSYGISPESSSDILSDTTVTGRFEIVEGLEDRTFIIDYAHNGVSLRSALSVLRSYDPTRIICVFGSVGGRTRERRQQLAEASSELSDYSIITSDNPDFEPPSVITGEIAGFFDKKARYEIIVDREAAVRRAVRMSEPGDIVLFAGKGHERYQLTEGVRVPFSEREIILDECNKIKAEKESDS